MGRFKAQYRLEGVKKIQAKMVLTMTIEDWQVLNDHLAGKSFTPFGELRSSINSLIAKANREFGADGVYPGLPPAEVD